MSDDKKTITTDPQNQGAIQSPPVTPASGTPFSTENVETPPPPITLSQEEAQKNQELPTAGSTVDIPPVVVTTNEARKYSLISKIGGKKMVATILGLLVLVGGVGAGVYLTKQSQEIREKAAGIQCSPSHSDENCRNLKSGDICDNLGNVCTGSGDDPTSCICKSSGGRGGGDDDNIPPAPQPTDSGNNPNQCISIKAYTVTGNPASLSSTWTEIVLKNNVDNLEAGDVIYFVVKATYIASGDRNMLIDKAKFTIREVEQAEATAKTPVCTSSTCTIEFYQKYTIPAGVYDYTVTAKLHLAGTSTWF